MLPNSLGGRLTSKAITDGILGRTPTTKYGCALLGTFFCLILFLLTGYLLGLGRHDPHGLSEFFNFCIKVVAVFFMVCNGMITLTLGVMRGERLWALLALFILAVTTIWSILS